MKNKKIILIFFLSIIVFLTINEFFYYNINKNQIYPESTPKYKITDVNTTNNFNLIYKYFNEYLYKAKGFEVIETEHFKLFFKQENRSNVQIVASSAEKTYDIIGEMFDFFPRFKIPVVIYADQSSMARAFGWPEEEKVQGVYYMGFIHLQSPLGNKDYFKEGPMVHEYTHLVVDELTGGNYSRWFTEGVAQYVEQQVTGYTLDMDFDVDEKTKYQLNDIFYCFDELPDTAVAYLAALDMTKALIGDGQIDEIKNVFSMLKSGACVNEIFLQSVDASHMEGEHIAMANNTYGGVQDE